MSPEPIEFSRRDPWGCLGLLVSSLFVAVGLILLFGQEMPVRTRWTGAGNVGFFGVCALFYLAQGRRPAIALRLEATGMEYRHPDPGQSFWVVWPAVAGARVTDTERASHVVVLFRSPEDLPASSAPDWAREPGAWPPLIPPETTLVPSTLGTTATELAEAIERFRRDYRHGGSDGTSGTGSSAPFV